MTKPVTGWLTQNPQLGQELVALDARLGPGQDDLLKFFGSARGMPVLTDEDVSLARRDWLAFVNRAHVAYVQVADYLTDVLQIARDPINGIRGIVEDVEPQAVLLRKLFEAEDCWVDAHTRPLLHRLQVRDSVML